MRRYVAMKPSRGTVIPSTMRARVYARDGGRCAPALVGIPHDCSPGRELDHVRASGAIGRKSVTCDCNLVTTCPNGHRVKTEHGKEARPILLAYLEQFDYGPHVEGHVGGDAA